MVQSSQDLPLIDSELEKETPYLFKGLLIVIEYLPGEERTKVIAGGRTITSLMPASYGFIVGINDQYGEEIDMYLASTPDPDSLIYVIDQITPGENTFDEHKVMLGFSSPEEAAHTYMSVFSDASGPKRLAAITSFTDIAFFEWIAMDGAVLEPASKYKTDGTETVSFITIEHPKSNASEKKVPIDEAGGVIISLPDMSGGPKLITTSSNGSFDYHLYFYGALDPMYWSNAIDTFCRTLDLASESDTMHIHIVSPGGSVVLMGRIVSAMSASKAKIITYAEGEVASAATAIWAAGDERHILPSAYFMQHMSSQQVFGKTTAIAAETKFCVDYIVNQLNRLIKIGLFTQSEVDDMVNKSADKFISGREAILRVGQISKGQGEPSHG